MNVNVNAFQKSFSSADFSADLSHFSTSNVPHYGNSKPTKSHQEAFEESLLEKELRWGSKKPRTPRKPQLMSEQELDSILDDLPMPDDFHMSEAFEFEDYLRNVLLKSDQRPSQEKVTEKVRASDWKSKYARLKEDPIKYDAYLVRKREQAKKKFDMRQELKRKLETHPGMDSEIADKLQANKLRQREYHRKYKQRIMENPETHQQYLARVRALHKKRKERREASKQS